MASIQRCLQDHILILPQHEEHLTVVVGVYYVSGDNYKGFRSYFPVTLGTDLMRLECSSGMYCIVSESRPDRV